MLDFPVEIKNVVLGVSERGFGTILVYAKGQEMQEVTKSDLEDFKDEAELHKLLVQMFNQKPAPQKVIIAGDLEKVSDYFFIVSPDNKPETIKKLSEHAQANNKIYAVTVGEEEQVAISETMSNTFAVYHETDKAGECLAVVMSYDVGEKTAKFEVLQGIAESNLSNKSVESLIKKNINCYINKLGTAQIHDGRLATGEFIDTLLVEYFIRFRMEEALQNVALRNKKIPYTNQGIGMMVGVVESVLKEAENRNMIVENQYRIDYKRREACTPEEVAKRDYSHIKWVATLAGAVHNGTITGMLSNELVKEVQ